MYVHPMRTQENTDLLVLVLNDVEEIRDGLAALLQSDGYQVEATRSEASAIECALRKSPQLILVNLAGSPEQVIAAGRRINDEARLQDRVPIVLFCIEGIEETKIHLGGCLYSTRPDNFNHLRSLLQHLLFSAPTY
jgi:CheY-like chemotaxis protein